MEYVIAGAAALIFGTLSAISGGGAGLVVAPLLILLGFDPQVALGTGKVGGLGLNIGTISRFAKHKEILDRKLLPIFASIAVLASIIGTQVVINSSSEFLEKLVAAVVFLVVPGFYIIRRIDDPESGVSRARKIFGIGLYSILTMLNAGIGSGIGILSVFVLMGVAGMSPLQANAMKRFGGIIVMTISSVIFIFAGFIDWKLAGVLFACNLTAGRIGARIAIKKGNEFVKNALMAAALVMALSLLLR